MSWNRRNSTVNLWRNLRHKRCASVLTQFREIGCSDFKEIYVNGPYRSCMGLVSYLVHSDLLAMLLDNYNKRHPQLLYNISLRYNRPNSHMEKVFLEINNTPKFVIVINSLYCILNRTLLKKCACPLMSCPPTPSIFMVELKDICVYPYIDVKHYSYLYAMLSRVLWLLHKCVQVLFNSV